MKHIDVRFNSDMMQMLQSMAGKVLEKFRCEPFEYSPLVYGVVGLYIGGEVFKLENYLEAQDFFGHTDDVAIFKFLPAVDTEIVSGFVNGQMVDTPIACRIRQIRVVDENQQLFVNGEQTYDVWLTRGVIFDLEDGREVSFEKSIWFPNSLTLSVDTACSRNSGRRTASLRSGRRTRDLSGNVADRFA